MFHKLARMKVRFAKNQKGMTLIELMAVVVIMGILATVAGAAVVNSFSSSKTGADKASAKIIADAAQRYYLDNNADPASVAALATAGYLTVEPVPQSTENATFTLTVAASGTYTVTP